MEVFEYIQKLILKIWHGRGIQEDVQIDNLNHLDGDKCRIATFDEEKTKKCKKDESNNFCS